MSQPLEAIAIANEVRFARFHLRRDIKAGHVLAAEVLNSDIPDWLKRMPVEQLVMASPRFQHRLYQRAMYRAEAKLTATIGDLTERKRAVLADQVGDWEQGRLDRQAKRLVAA